MILNIAVAREPAPPPSSPGGLLPALAAALQAEGVAYCQWKGHWKRARWESGAGDVDLLVDPASSQRICRTLHAHGFKPTLPPPEAQLAGTESWFGYDVDRGVLLHIHVHFRLIIGSYWTTIYRLPIERAVLATAEPHEPFPVPAPDVELLLFMIRQLQRAGTVEVLRRRLSGTADEAIAGEFQYLRQRTDWESVITRARELLPAFDPQFVQDCLRAFEAGPSSRELLRLRRELHRRVRMYARRPAPLLFVKRLARRLRLAPPPHGMRSLHGGTVVALLGGDGAGKSTCAAALRAWLGDQFDLLCAHLGRPPRSIMTAAVGALLKVQRLVRRMMGAPVPAPDWSSATEDAGLTQPLELLRVMCTARDRYLLFRKIRRHAADGGIALCERYPTPHERLLVGPEIARRLGPGRYTRLQRFLVRAEQMYYERIARPDVTLVMMVDPEVAVHRKTTEPADYVRLRSGIVRNTDWSGSGAQVIDAGRPLPEVIADLKARIWEEI